MITDFGGVCCLWWHVLVVNFNKRVCYSAILLKLYFDMDVLMLRKDFV